MVYVIQWGIGISIADTVYADAAAFLEYRMNVLVIKRTPVSTDILDKSAANVPGTAFLMSMHCSAEINVNLLL